MVRFEIITDFNQDLKCITTKSTGFKNQIDQILQPKHI